MPTRKKLKRQARHTLVTPKAVEAYQTYRETREAWYRCFERRHGAGEGDDGKCLPGCNENREARDTLRWELGVAPWEDYSLLFQEKGAPWPRCDHGNWPERAKELRRELKALTKT